MGPKSIFVCLQSNPKGLNMTHKAQNQFPKVLSLLLMHKLKLSRSRIDSQLPKLDHRDLSLTHSGSKSTSSGSKATPRPKLTYRSIRHKYPPPLLRPKSSFFQISGRLHNKYPPPLVSRPKYQFYGYL